MKKVEYINKEQVNKDTKAKAWQNMTGSELRLYLYLLDMMNACTTNWFPLDRWEVVNYYGISITSYQRALNGLKDLGYVRKKDSQTYCFDVLGGYTK